MPNQPPRRDLLQECDEKKVPLQEILQGWCPRCVNPGCTRSQWGKSKFEDRVIHWEERLFLNPAKLDPSDPRFSLISAKNFLTIAPGTPGAPTSEWVDPRHTRTEPLMVQVPAIVQPVPAPYTPPVVVEAPKAAPEVVVVTPTEVPAIVAPVTPAVVQKAPIASPVLQNTTVKPQQMIDGGPRSSQTSVLDPWAPKPSLSNSGERIVEPGAKIKLGGG